MDDEQKAKKPVKQKLFFPLPSVVKNEPKVYVGSDEEMKIKDFNFGAEDELYVICNKISVLSLEYDTVTKVTKDEDWLAKEMDTHKPLCYYVIHGSFINKEKDIFERPNMSMQKHMNSSYIRAEVEGVRVNKVLIDCGACINVMLHSLLKRIIKYDTDLKSNNMILSNFEGKTSKPLGIIQVDVVIGTITQPTLFVVIPTEVNYNLLLGQ